MLRSIVCAALALSPVPALAAPSSAAPPPAAAVPSVDPAVTVADLRRILAANYVLRETRPKIDAVLAAGLASGRYRVSDPLQLAERLNADLDSAVHDKHLGVMFDPKRNAELAALPGGAHADDAPATPEEIRQAVKTNHGIVELKLLDGNIRYMRYDGFKWAGPKTAEAMDTAMRFLAGGDAAIIDLRGNGGGSPDAVRYLASYFLPPERPLVTFYMRGDPAETLSTIAKLPAARLTGKPLYILTSRYTASAAEEFVGHIAGYKAGELVGEGTAGAGYRNEFFAVAGGFVASVSVGRAVLASTGKDWEGVGLAPTVKVAADKALDQAQVLVLRRLASTATGADKRDLDARSRLLEAQLSPVKTVLPPQGYAGTYGERTVRTEGDRITIQREGGPVFPLLAIGPNTFAYVDDPATTVTFDLAGGQARALHLLRADGSTADGTRAN